MGTRKEALTSIQMADMFIQARDEGFCGDLTNPHDCISECDNCPASPACRFLSLNGDYEAFKENYADIIPIITERDK